jgi:hypothetical protein
LGLDIVLQISLDGVRGHWSRPLRPLSTRVKKKFAAKYRAWRNQCIADFARKHGLTAQPLRYPGMEEDVVALRRADGEPTPKDEQRIVVFQHARMLSTGGKQ